MHFYFQCSSISAGAMIYLKAALVLLITVRMFVGVLVTGNSEVPGERSVTASHDPSEVLLGMTRIKSVYIT